ncbi:hypothetical protein [Bacillus sp. SA1-12]|uniref:hypothetical protein n=1 Tax=Bacillus sp. SA1-12 TaxID=1455638 RepID=UPI000698B196|nr:hypothetical protein [Bacillus sp. SA1-12]
MLVKMIKQDFDLLKHKNISQACFKPLITIYKNRIAAQTSVTEMKEKFYEELSDGQRALFMFYAYYNHVIRSPVELYWWSANFMAQPKSWSAIKASIEYFDDQSMLILLTNVESVLIAHDHPNTLKNFSVKREDLEQNNGLKTSFNSFYESLVNSSAEMICRINRYIKDHHQHFIEFEDF